MYSDCDRSCQEESESSSKDFRNISIMKDTMLHVPRGESDPSKALRPAFEPINIAVSRERGGRARIKKANVARKRSPRSMNPSIHFAVFSADARCWSARLSRSPHKEAET